MGDIARYLREAFHQALQAVECRIQVYREPIEFVVSM